MVQVPSSVPAILTAQLKIREPLQWKMLHLEAGKWLEENGYLYEAVDHYLAGTGYEEALTLLETIAPALMINEWTTLCTWLSAIPDSLLFARPMLFLTKLASQYMSGRIEAATDGYWWAVRRLEQNTASHQSDKGKTLQAGLAFLAAFRTFLDRDFDYAVQYSKEYVERHPEGDFFIGFGSDRDGYHPVWNIYVSDDSLILAEQVLTPLLSIWSASRNVYFIAHLCIVSANCSMNAIVWMKRRSICVERTIPEDRMTIQAWRRSRHFGLPALPPYKETRREQML